MRCFLVAFVLAGAASLGAQPPGVLSGDYLEGRSNKVLGCYCEWSGESQTGGHEAILAWRIRSGAWRGTSLAGVRMQSGGTGAARSEPARRRVAGRPAVLPSRGVLSRRCRAVIRPVRAVEGIHARGRHGQPLRRARVRRHPELERTRRHRLLWPLRDQTGIA